MSPFGQSTKHLVEVDFGPSGLGVQPILPVHHENLQARAPCVVWFKRRSMSLWSSTFLRLSVRQLSLRDFISLEERIENPIYEPWRVLSTISFSQMDPFLNGDLGRDFLQEQEFGSRQTENGSVHDR